MIYLPFALLFSAIALVWAPNIVLHRAPNKPLGIPPWAIALIAAMLTGIWQGVLLWQGALALVVLFALVMLAKQARHTLIKVAALWACVLAVLAFGLHLVPGFNNPQVLSETYIGNATIAYQQYINFDKTAAGLLLLALLANRASNYTQLAQTVRTAVPISLAGVAIIFSVAWLLGAPLDPKWLAYTAIFLLINLFATCVAEEAFMRSLIQQPLQNALQRASKKLAPWLATGISAVIFTALHIGHPQPVPFLSMVFLAGLLYGYLYQKTGRVEAAIIGHFLLNAVNFVLFVYPVSFT